MQNVALALEIESNKLKIAKIPSDIQEDIMNGYRFVNIFLLSKIEEYLSQQDIGLIQKKIEQKKNIFDNGNIKPGKIIEDLKQVVSSIGLLILSKVRDDGLKNIQKEFQKMALLVKNSLTNLDQQKQ